MVSQLRIDVGRHFRLREVHADSNKFQSLMVERSHAAKQESQLRSINLSCNHLGKYEGHITGLHNLGSALLDLNLSQNFLESISFVEGHKNSFFGLRQLRTLNLANNQIKKVYFDNTARWPSLKYLDISYNRLEGLSFLALCEGLTVLRV